MKLSFGELMQFLQNPPSQLWNCGEDGKNPDFTLRLIQRAYTLQNQLIYTRSIVFAAFIAAIVACVCIVLVLAFLACWLAREGLFVTFVA
jgi:hypothetical protein